MDCETSFIHAVDEFISWADADPEDPRSDARKALSLLSKLYFHGLKLRSSENVALKLEGARISDEAWTKRFDRFSTLPVGYYGDVLDLRDPIPEPMLGDVADDLADIYRDLMEGLSLERTGNRAEAIHAWRLSFEIHWGAHAVSAIKVLHDWARSEAAW